MSDSVPEFKGLSYIPDIISDEFAAELVQFLDKRPWSKVSKSDTGRLVQQFGFRYAYSGSKKFEEIEPFPEIIQKLQKIVLEFLQKKKIAEIPAMNQCIINNYVPGQGISAHIDLPDFGPVVACFTICSGTEISFSQEFENEEYTAEKYVDAGSLYIMSGPVRYLWKHAIKSRKSDMVEGSKKLRGRRISITFRTVTE